MKVLVEETEQVLLAIAFYNTDNSSMDQETCDEPLNFHCLDNVLQRTYQFPQSLEVLNDFPCFCAVYDLREQGNPKQMWANAAWLNYLGQTLDSFQGSDGGSLRADLEDVRTSTIEHRTAFVARHRIEHKGAVVLVEGIYRPVLFEGFDAPLVVCTVVPPGFAPLAKRFSLFCGPRPDFRCVSMRRTYGGCDGQRLLLNIHLETAKFFCGADGRVCGRDCTGA